jgi:hypothetical protein
LPPPRQIAKRIIADSSFSRSQGQSRHFDIALTTSGLPLVADNFRAGWHVRKVPISLKNAVVVAADCR